MSLYLCFYVIYLFFVLLLRTDEDVRVSGGIRYIYLQIIIPLILFLIKYIYNLQLSAFQNSNIYSICHYVLLLCRENLYLAVIKNHSLVYNTLIT